VILGTIAVAVTWQFEGVSTGLQAAPSWSTQGGWSTLGIGSPSQPHTYVANVRSCTLTIPVTISCEATPGASGAPSEPLPDSTIQTGDEVLYEARS
jgi:hypothetical protein